jgi:hypothetical protein
MDKTVSSLRGLEYLVYSDELDGLVCADATFKSSLMDKTMSSLHGLECLV